MKKGYYIFLCATLAIATSMFMLFFINTSNIYNAKQSLDSKKINKLKKYTNQPNYQLVVTEKRNDLLSDIANKKGIKAALIEAKASNNPAEEIKYVLMLGVFLDPEIVADELNKTNISQIDKQQILHSLMSNWQNTDEALKWINKELSGRSKSDAISIILAKIAKENPEKAINLAEGLPIGTGRDQAECNILSALAEVNIKTALEFINKLSSDKDLFPLINSIAPLWVENEYSSAVDFFENNLDNSDAAFLGHLIGLKMIKKDPQKSLNQLANLQGIAADRARRSAMIEWVDKDVDAAAQFVNSLGKNEQSKYGNALVSAWAENDPAAAANWVAKIQDEELKTSVTLRLLHRWQPIDAAEAAQWLNNLPEGPTKHEGFKFLNARDSVPLDKRFRIYPELYIESADDVGFFDSKIMCSDCGVIHPTTVGH
ncbi:MAG: hypothetical protein QM680_04820 [Luteolibacter sp.]